MQIFLGHLWYGNVVFSLYITVEDHTVHIPLHTEHYLATKTQAVAPAVVRLIGYRVI